MSLLPGTLEGFFAWAQAQPYATSPHLARLRALASGLSLAVEFGVKRAGSSAALLLGAERVISYDIADTPHARHLKQIAGDRWDYRLQDSRTAPVTPCDLLFVDAQHDYEHCAEELQRHGDAVRRWLVFHDHLTFGWIGADRETGRHKWTFQPGQSVPLNCLGIRQAVDEFMAARPEWRIHVSYPDSHGLLVLRREAA